MRRAGILSAERTPIFCRLRRDGMSVSARPTSVMGSVGAGLEEGRQDRVDRLGGATEGEEAERITRGRKVRVDEGGGTAALGVEKRRWRGHRGSRGSA